LKINPTGAWLSHAPTLEASMAMANGSGTMEVNGTRSSTPGAKPGLQTRVGMAPKTVKRQKEQSSIAFPYVDMDSAITVARAMYESGGFPCTREQLAGAMKTSPGNGSFIMKCAGARMFGLIESKDGKYQLTQLGFNILDEAREKAARVDSFLCVPLFKRAYEEFKNRQLPPRPLGLENAFVQFGVSPKQKANARLAFEKSARQAGYSTIDPDRLIEPILGPTGPTGVTAPRAPHGLSPVVSVSSVGLEATSAAAGKGSATITEVDTNLDPLIRGLLSRLPKAGEKWDANKRARWLQTLAANFDMVYQSDDGDKIIIIECKDTPKTS
jgi:hypothetical protein